MVRVLRDTTKGSKDVDTRVTMSTHKTSKKNLTSGTSQKSKGDGVKHKKVLRNNIQGLTKNALARILYRAGIKRISSLVYEELRGITKVYLENFLKTVHIFVIQSRRKTVLISDVYATAAFLGSPLLSGINKNAKTTKNLSTCKSVDSKSASRAESDGRRSTTEGTKKAHRFLPGTVALRKIRKYQKNSDCLVFPKLNFRRLVAEIYQDYAEDLVARFQKGAIALIQLATEEYLVGLSENANLIAIHADRETVYPKDFQLVRRMRLERA